MNEHMRILIVSRIYRPEPSAASFFLGSVADGLIEAGHQVDVFTAKPLALHTDSLRGSRGETIKVFPVIRNRDGYLRGYLQYMSFDIPLVFRLLCTRRPDAIFVEPPPTTGAVVRAICALRRIPYVYDAADVWSDAAQQASVSALVHRVLQRIEAFAMRGAAGIVTISEGVASRVSKFGLRVAPVVTGYGADTESFFYVTPPKDSVEPQQKPTFIYAGTFSEVHGASVLIDAFALFSKTHPGYQLVFVGNGSEKDLLRQRAHELGITDEILIETSVLPEHLRHRFAHAVCSLATLREGTGYEYAFATKIYSSLASGCPVIFAGPGPTRDFMIRENAHIAPSTSVEYDAEFIAEAMRDIVDKKVSAHQRRELAQWTENHYSMKSVALKIVEVIEDSARGG